jgi:hypothetical protein
LPLLLPAQKVAAVAGMLAALLYVLLRRACAAHAIHAGCGGARLVA